MPRGGKRPDAGRPARHQRTVAVRLGDDERELLERLQASLQAVRDGTVSQGDVVAEGLRALDRELRKPPARRKGPSAVVA